MKQTSLQLLSKHCVLVAALVSAAGASACASSPKNIAPQYVSAFHYSGLSCTQLTQELARANDALTVASKAQKSARAGDLFSLAVLGMPTSALSGTDQTPYIGKLKGDVAAMNIMNTQKECDTQVAAFEPVSEELPVIRSAAQLQAEPMAAK